MKYRLSRKAVEDLRDIARYTTAQFGGVQSIRYRDSFIQCFETLCNNPNMGRSYDHIRQNLRRFDHDQHAIFYMVQKDTLVIVCVLHRKRDMSRHL